MQDLTLVGLSEDGSRLVLASVTGEEFAVPVDTRLRAALRGETTARDRQWETKMDSALRPRDIQARIRAGESPEDVAAAARTTVEAIMPFAGPVIAERQHVASNALKGSLRRRTGETTTAARTLGEAAELFFSHHSLHDEDVEWDAWRRPDGRWALVATYEIGGRPRSAEFTHDQPGRYVVAENDEAKVLTGELALPGQAPPAGRAGNVRPLSPVPTQDELPLGDDAIELVRDPEPAREPSSAEPRVATADPVAVPVTELGADTADADWLAGPPRPSDEDVPLLEEPGGPEASQETVEAEASQETEETEETATTGGHDGAEETQEIAEIADDAAAEDPSSTPSSSGTGAPARTEKSSRRKGRSSVPSWDEIMFGGSARED